MDYQQTGLFEILPVTEFLRDRSQPSEDVCCKYRNSSGLCAEPYLLHIIQRGLYSSLHFKLHYIIYRHSSDESKHTQETQIHKIEYNIDWCLDNSLVFTTSKAKKIFNFSRKKDHPNI
ncbi:hypothetical protein GOODEAATRI_033157 [Goodea atripinnis]|uniref:Uncharacterized protein n=1 Tax=Goodea atripinnis TaxID=208336 RepID=A0ABV0MX62_9TELE